MLCKKGAPPTGTGLSFLTRISSKSATNVGSDEQQRCQFALPEANPGCTSVASMTVVPSSVTMNREPTAVKPTVNHFPTAPPGIAFRPSVGPPLSTALYLPSEISVGEMDRFAVPLHFDGDPRTSQGTTSRSRQAP